jgi:hypothetical protein
MEIETSDCDIISDIDIVDSPVVIIYDEYEGFVEREKREKDEKENDNSKLEIKSKVVEKGLEKRLEKRLEIVLTINTTTCDEVIFKKHIVDIIDKDTKCCIMNGVVTHYEFEGRPWDPVIVIIFENGQRFCNYNFGYMFRYYI